MIDEVWLFVELVCMCLVDGGWMIVVFIGEFGELIVLVLCFG